MGGWGRLEVRVRKLLAARSSWGARYDNASGCIHYVSDVTGLPQAWRSCRGRSDLLLVWPRRVGEVLPSHRGSIAFSSDFDGDERWAIYLYGDDKVDLIAGEDGSMNLLGAWSDREVLAYTSNARNSVDFDLYIYSGESPEMVVKGEGISVPYHWLGNKVLLVKRNTNLDSDIVIVDPEKGSWEVITAHEGEAANDSPAPLDSRRILYATNEGREYKALAMMNLESGERKIIFEPRGDVEAVAYGGGGIAYVSVNEKGSSALYVISVDAWKARPLAVFKAKWVISSLDPLPGGRGVLVSASSPREGAEVYLVEGVRVERVTWSPKLGLEGELVEPVDFEYESFDGLRIHGLLYKPRGVKLPVPAVYWLHGGPESQARPSFNPLIQAIVSLGVAVVAPNFRGSTGYGKTFVHLDDVEKRMDAVRDVYHAVKSLVDGGVVDPERLCVMGGSYGGYLTLMNLAIYPELWRCGVEIVGIVNLVTFIRNTSPYRRRYRIVEYGDPDKHYDIMMKLSPITYVDRIKAPLMVVHGARDPRVPVSEAEQLVEALKARRVEVKYLRLEDEGHGISKIENRVRVYTEAVKFIASHLGVSVP